MLNTRLALAALALWVIASPGHAQERSDLTGVWVAESAPSSHALEPNYFRAELSQRDAGIVAGSGVVNLCAGCRGLDEYEVSWRGRWSEDGTFELIGTPTSAHGRWRSVAFSGSLTEAGAIEGALTRASDGRAEAFVMERLAPSSPDADEGE